MMMLVTVVSGSALVSGCNQNVTHRNFPVNFGIPSQGDIHTNDSSAKTDLYQVRYEPESLC